MTEVESREEDLDLILRLKRFALVLTGDDRRAEALLRQLGDPRQDPEMSPIPQGALQFMRFRELYELWHSDPRSKNSEARIFAKGHEDEAIRKGLDPSLAAVLGTLPSRHRALLLLVYGENFSYAATARLLGMPIDRLMAALAGARRGIGQLAPCTEPQQKPAAKAAQRG